MYTNIYICITYIYVYIYTYACTYFTYIHIYIYTCLYLYIHIHTHNTDIHIFVYIHIYLYASFYFVSWPNWDPAQPWRGRQWIPAQPASSMTQSHEIVSQKCAFSNQLVVVVKFQHTHIQSVWRRKGTPVRAARLKKGKVQKDHQGRKTLGFPPFAVATNKL